MMDMIEQLEKVQSHLNQVGDELSGLSSTINANSDVVAKTEAIVKQYEEYRIVMPQQKIDALTAIVRIAKALNVLRAGDNISLEPDSDFVTREGFVRVGSSEREQWEKVRLNVEEIVDGKKAHLKKDDLWRITSLLICSAITARLRKMEKDSQESKRNLKDVLDSLKEIRSLGFAQ